MDLKTLSSAYLVSRALPPRWGKRREGSRDEVHQVRACKRGKTWINVHLQLNFSFKRSSEGHWPLLQCRRDRRFQYCNQKRRFIHVVSLGVRIMHSSKKTSQSLTKKTFFRGNDVGTVTISVKCYVGRNQRIWVPLSVKGYTLWLESLHIAQCFTFHSKHKQSRHFHSQMEL